MDTMGRPQLAFPSPARLFTPGVTVILILSLIGFLLSVFASGMAMELLALSARHVLHGRVWQLMTYPFVESLPMNLIFTMLMVLFVGSAIEREWRTASFLLLWLVITVVCGVIWVLVNLLLGYDSVGSGASACSYGFIAALGLLFRGKSFFVLFATVKAEYLAMILIGIAIIMNIMTPMNLVWVMGALVAYVYVKLCWRVGAKKSRNVGPRGRSRPDSFVDID
ncbi:MAG TPA: rhomboid family intramembrane serine protease [Sedimentisphaerales bacterium]|nr:rhomboid family intramembrane serine protease [Sedimentisphaerales bacterium]